MGEKVILALVSALVGAALSFLANWYLNRRKVLSDAKLRQAFEVLGYLSRTIHREGPDTLQDKVSELKNEWAQQVRALYLLNVPATPRESIDTAIVNYLDALAELREKPDRRTEVERRREIAVKESYRFMRTLGL